jgi:hypothetical protein
MNKLVSDAIKNVADKNLDEMKSNFSAALSAKAVEKLNEKKIEVAKRFFKKA